jgi:hypothetical protein
MLIVFDQAIRPHLEGHTVRTTAQDG